MILLMFYDVVVQGETPMIAKVEMGHLTLSSVCTYTEISIFPEQQAVFSAALTLGE